MALIGFGIGVAFEVSKAQAPAFRPDEVFVHVPEAETQWCQHRLGALDQFDKLRALTAKHKPNCVFAELLFVRNPIANYSVGFAAAACAAEGYIVGRTSDERRLARGRLPNYLLGSSGRIVFCHSSISWTGAGKRDIG